MEHKVYTLSTGSSYNTLFLVGLLEKLWEIMGQLLLGDAKVYVVRLGI